jgi:hypothetical protein
MPEGQDFIDGVQCLANVQGRWNQGSKYDDFTWSHMIAAEAAHGRPAFFPCISHH